MKRAQSIFHWGLVLGLASVLGCQGGGDGQDSGSDKDPEPDKETSSGDDGSGTASSSESNDATSQDDSSSDAATTADESPGVLSPQAYCEAFSKAFCKGEADCCEASDKKFPSVSACETELQERCATDIMVLVNDERTGYDGKTAAAQLERLKGLAASCDLKTAQWFAGTDGLMAMYKGTVEEGKSCTPSSNEDAAAMLACKDDGFCLLTPIPLSGTCAKAGRTKGATCYAHVECADGLYCTAPKDGAGTCETPAAIGASCEDGFWCASLYCEASKCVEATKDRVYCAK